MGDRKVEQMKYWDYRVVRWLKFLKHLPKCCKTKEEGVAVVKFSGMGEALLTLPAIRQLKKQFGRVVVFALKRRAGIVYEYSNDVDEVIYPSLKWVNAEFEHAYDFELFTQSSALITRWLGKYSHGFNTMNRDVYTHVVEFDEDKHTARNYCRLVGGCRIRMPNNSLLNIKEEEKQRVERMIKTWKRPIIAVHPSTEKEAPQRRWPYFKQLIRGLKESTVVITGKGKEEDHIAQQLCENTHAINLSSKLTFGELAWLYKRSDVVIANDTGPMHLAATVNPNVIGLFGPSLPKWWGPLAGTVIYKPGTCERMPCMAPHKLQFPKCDNNVCMKSITVEEVLEVVKDIIKR